MTGAPRSSAVDKAAYQKAQQSGLAFKSRDQAAGDFKQKYSSKYTSTFATQPASRPSYIPNSYVTGGRTVIVDYNPTYRGYGYMDPLTHAWIAYSIMSDMAMMNRQMAMNGYYVGSPDVVYVDDGPSRPMGTGARVFIWIFAIAIVGGVAFILLRLI